MKLSELLFGVGISDHQSESFDAAYPDFRDEWEKRPNQTSRGRATGFWHRYPKDIELARDLGCKIFRFSLSWAHIQPTRQSFNHSALEHYQHVVSKVKEFKMIPLVTLHHLTWPIHVQDRGGMIADDFPEWFSEYVSRGVDSLGDHVTHWVTFNEPNQLAYGYIKHCWHDDLMVPPVYTF